MGLRAVFPGTFDPLTVAHLVIADAVRDQLDAAVVELVISEDPIGKDTGTPVAERLEAIERQRSERPWLRASSTALRLLADIADGYDVLVVGADKWHQLHDPVFYDGSPAARDAAITRLPTLAVVPRSGVVLPDDVPVLDVPEDIHQVSSTAVRAGREEWRA